MLNYVSLGFATVTNCSSCLGQKNQPRHQLPWQLVVLLGVVRRPDDRVVVDDIGERTVTAGVGTGGRGGHGKATGGLGGPGAGAGVLEGHGATTGGLGGPGAGIGGLGGPGAGTGGLGGHGTGWTESGCGFGGLAEIVADIGGLGLAVVVGGLVVINLRRPLL